jgi:hypothetical protein
MRVFQTLSVFLFTWISSLSQQVFTAFEPIAPSLIEWDQSNTTFYTGQTIQLNWTSQNFGSSDLARIQYPGSGGTRTLTSGSGTPILSGTYSVRLSDSGNGVASNVPLTIALATNTAISLSSSTRISVIQSRLINIVPLDGTRTLGGGQNTVCDDRNLTVMWRGLGEAQFGSVSVVLRRQSGFSGTQTLASVSGIPVSGNTSVTMVCPRTTSPSSSNSYAFQLTVNEPGGADYTGTSPSFTVAVAPTPTPTPTSSPSPTSSSTPSPSPSKTPTPSVSITSTPTPSQTPTVSPTPSTSETARPSIDYIAIGRAAADQVDTTTPAVAGALGGIGGILIVLGGVKWYREKVLTERRKRKQAMTSRFVQQATSLYGIKSSPSDDPFPDQHQPSIVLYSVQGVPPKGQTDPTSQLTPYKKAFPPKQSGV